MIIKNGTKLRFAGIVAALAIVGFSFASCEGPAGPRGLDGDDGAAGVAGAPGTAGAAGPTGPGGATGGIGPAGPAGGTGPGGAAGAGGAEGAPGQDAVVIPAVKTLSVTAVDYDDAELDVTKSTLAESVFWVNVPSEADRLYFTAVLNENATIQTVLWVSGDTDVIQVVRATTPRSMIAVGDEVRVIITGNVGERARLYATALGGDVVGVVTINITDDDYDANVIGTADGPIGEAGFRNVTIQNVGLNALENAEVTLGGSDADAFVVGPVGLMALNDNNGGFPLGNIAPGATVTFSVSVNAEFDFDEYREFTADVTVAADGNADLVTFSVSHEHVCPVCVGDEFCCLHCERVGDYCNDLAESCATAAWYDLLDDADYLELITARNADLLATGIGFLVRDRGTDQHDHNNGFNIDLDGLRELFVEGGGDEEDAEIVIIGFADASEGRFDLQGTGLQATIGSNGAFRLTVPYDASFTEPWGGAGSLPFLATGGLGQNFDYIVTEITIGGYCIKAVLADDFAVTDDDNDNDA